MASPIFPTGLTAAFAELVVFLVGVEERMLGLAVSIHLGALSLQMRTPDGRFVYHQRG